MPSTHPGDSDQPASGPPLCPLCPLSTLCPRRKIADRRIIGIEDVQRTKLLGISASAGVVAVCVCSMGHSLGWIMLAQDDIRELGYAFASNDEVHEAY